MKTLQQLMDDPAGVTVASILEVTEDRTEILDAQAHMLARVQLAQERAQAALAEHKAAMTQLREAWQNVTAADAACEQAWRLYAPFGAAYDRLAEQAKLRTRLESN